jgi:hypothetical protein
LSHDGYGLGVFYFRRWGFQLSDHLKDHLDISAGCTYSHCQVNYVVA